MVVRVRYRKKQWFSLGVIVPLMRYATFWFWVNASLATAITLFSAVNVVVLDWNAMFHFIFIFFSHSLRFGIDSYEFNIKAPDVNINFLISFRYMKAFRNTITCILLNIYLFLYITNLFFLFLFFPFSPSYTEHIEGNRHSLDCSSTDHVFITRYAFNSFNIISQFDRSAQLPTFKHLNLNCNWLSVKIY